MRLADLSFATRDGALVVTVTGEVDMSNAERLGSAMLESIPSEALGVVIDLSRVGYLDSAGIHVIYGLRERLRARGQRLLLVIPDGSPVADALRLAGVGFHVEVAGTLEAALEEMGPSPAGG